MRTEEVRHFHIFCGLGGGAKGFNAGEARVGNVQAQFRCIGGIDSDASAIADFDKLAQAKGTVLDMFDRSQYIDWHGMEPPEDWKEATPEDIHRAAGYERPHIIFTSPPCKGFSGLLAQGKSETDKYQALNRLTVRGIWLSLEAFKDDPVEFFILENVPRIATRGRSLLDQIINLLERYGYAVAETTHDCGELGGLAQSRKRFLLVARHQEKVPPFLYEPQTKSLKSVGDILGSMPLPGDEIAGPMHRVPNLQWKTWVRLAFVEAGKDWRSLQRLDVENGFLKDFGIMPEAEWQNSVLGVRNWNEPTGTVAGRSTPGNGAYCIADPRMPGKNDYGQYGVMGFDESSGTITSQRSPGQGRFSIADPRMPNNNKNRHNGFYRVVDYNGQAHTVTGAKHVAGTAMSVNDPRINGERHKNVFRVVNLQDVSPTVTAGTGPTSGGIAVADPRGTAFGGKYKVTGYDDAAPTVISGSTTGQGAFAVADPRPGLGKNGQRESYQTAGHYGVVPFDQKSYAVPGKAKLDRGPWSVADPRVPESGDFTLPSERDQGAFVIESLDGTWHRPFTTMELAALQGLIDAEEFIELHGKSDSAWRERIGNAVPAPTAAAIASVMGTTLLLAWSGETFVLNSMPIWVQPLVVATSVDNINTGLTHPI